MCQSVGVFKEVIKILCLFFRSNPSDRDFTHRRDDDFTGIQTVRLTLESSERSFQLFIYLFVL